MCNGHFLADYILDNVLVLQAWFCITTPDKFFTEIQKIVTGISAQKLYAYQSTVGPLDVILQGMVMFGVNNPDEIDDLSQCFECGKCFTTRLQRKGHTSSTAGFSLGFNQAVCTACFTKVPAG